MSISVTTNSVQKNLEIISAKELQDKELPQLNIIVQNILYQGLTVLASQPKIGKSWLSLDIAVCVATGQPIWNNETLQRDVLYLALEDSFNRLQSRLNLILNDMEAPNNLYLSIMSSSISTGLLEELNNFLITHPNTKLIIIDTLQKVRDTMKTTETAYGYDYKEVGALKKFADLHGISILLVHHLRKARDKDDVFNQISGTNGIAGAADTMIVLSKPDRMQEETLFSITGRDVESYEQTIKFDKDTCHWTLLTTPEQLLEIRKNALYDNDPVVITIKELLKEFPNGFEISSSDLLDQIYKITGITPKQKSPASLTKYINDLCYKLQQNDNIFYSPPNPNGGSKGRTLYFCSPNRSNENIENTDENKTYDPILGYQ